MKNRDVKDRLTLKTVDEGKKLFLLQSEFWGDQNDGSSNHFFVMWDNGNNRGTAALDDDGGDDGGIVLTVLTIVTNEMAWLIGNTTFVHPGFHVMV